MEVELLPRQEDAVEDTQDTALAAKEEMARTIPEHAAMHEHPTKLGEVLPI